MPCPYWKKLKKAPGWFSFLRKNRRYKGNGEVKGAGPAKFERDANCAPDANGTKGEVERAGETPAVRTATAEGGTFGREWY